MPSAGPETILDLTFEQRLAQASFPPITPEQQQRLQQIIPMGLNPDQMELVGKELLTGLGFEVYEKRFSLLEHMKRWVFHPGQRIKELSTFVMSPRRLAHLVGVFLHTPG